MSKTLLSLAADLRERAELVHIVSRDTADFDTQALARAILSLALDLEQQADALTQLGNRYQPRKPGTGRGQGQPI